MKNSKQSEVFNSEEQVARLTEMKYPLVGLKVRIDWEAFLPKLNRVYEKDRESQGMKPFDALLLFKILVLQQLFNLSDDKIEYQIKDRLSFMAFLALQQKDPVPDAKTVSLFRLKLKSLGLFDGLFVQFHMQLLAEGYIARAGQMVEPTFVEVPKELHNSAENAQVKERQSHDALTEAETKAQYRQVVYEKRWSKENREEYYVHKKQINENILPVCRLVPENISIKDVQNLFPIRNYDNEKLMAFTAGLKSEVFPRQTVLFHSGDKTNSAFYLLKGTILLASENGKSSEIEAGTKHANFPIIQDAATTASAKTDVSVLRVSHKILSPKHAPMSERSRLTLSDELSKNRLLSSFAHHYDHEELNIFSLPYVAAKLRESIQKDAGVADIVKIIHLDPIISAKLIGLANSPLYVNTHPISSCLEAVTRIGLTASCNYIISLSLGRTFNSSSPLIKQYMDKHWKQSIYTSKLCYCLAVATKQVDPQEALLAGLICDIGAVALLCYAANLPIDYYSESDIESALSYVKGPVGYKVLLDWGFSEAFLEIPIYSDDWRHNNSDDFTLADMVVLSRLHIKIGQSNLSGMPPIASIPAVSKLKDVSFSPEFSLNIISEAKRHINEAIK